MYYGIIIRRVNRVILRHSYQAVRYESVLHASSQQYSACQQHVISLVKHYCFYFIVYANSYRMTTQCYQLHCNACDLLCI